MGRCLAHDVTRNLAVALSLFLTAPTARSQIVNSLAEVDPERPIAFVSSRWNFQVLESTVSLNGDADVLDHVHFVHHEPTGVVSSIGMAAPSTLAGATPLVSLVASYFAVPEWLQGNADLTGDGDALDLALLRYTFETQSVTTLGIAGAYLQVSIDDEAVLCVAHESPGVDYNGDGDTLDAVLHRYVPYTGVLTNLAIATDNAFILPGGDVIASVGPIVIYPASSATPIGIGTSGLLGTPDVGIVPILESESLLGDVNGDGDASDSIVSAWNSATATRVSSNLAGRDLVLKNGRVAFIASEADSGNVDLDGDGDAFDDVLCVLDCASGAVTVLAEAAGAASSFVMSGDRIAYPASEAWLAAYGQNPDLNHDGDTTDFVMTVLDLSSNERHRGRAVAASTRATLEGEFAGYLAREVDEGGTDLDGDGALTNVYVIDRFFGEIVDSRPILFEPLDTTGTAGAQATTGRITVVIGEQADGIDHNGDGDALDPLLASIDVANGTYRVVPLAIASFALGPDRVGVAVVESMQGGDLNGDGDQLDAIFHRVTIPGGYSGKVVDYGVGCTTGVGGIATLDLHGDLATGGRAMLVASGAVPGETALIVLGTGMASIPTGLGCPLLVAPVLPAWIGPLPLAANGLLHGSIAIPVTVPAGAAGASGTMQAFVTDPLHGFVPSNGVAFTFAD
jgi:hypothetical protein